MTARLATHPDVTAHAPDVLDRLMGAGVDVEPVMDEAPGDRAGEDLLKALREGHLDLVVVGVRALGGTVADRLTMLAVLPREDPRDALVTVSGRKQPLRAVRAGARIGVHGRRRRAFLMAHRPDVEAVEIEAGCGPALEEDSGLDAVVIGAWEARTAGLGQRVAEVMDPRSWLPEPGHGAVAVMGRHPIAEVTALDHLPTRTALRAELALLDALDAPPDTALGSLAQPSGRLVRLWAAGASVDGTRLVRADLTGPLDEPQLLGASVARLLKERGVRLALAGARG